jgi:hypothetical protein
MVFPIFGSGTKTYLPLVDTVVKPVIMNRELVVYSLNGKEHVRLVLTRTLDPLGGPRPERFQPINACMYLVLA